MHAGTALGRDDGQRDGVLDVLRVNSTVPPGESLRCGRTERATSLARRGFQKAEVQGKRLKFTVKKLEGRLPR